MCGIVCSLTPYSSTLHDTSTDTALASLRAAAAQRGPHASGSYTRLVASPGHGPLRLTLASSVLALRGVLTPQPLVSARGALVYNGQAFAGLDVATHRGNDTRALFARLDAGEAAESVFAAIEGPYAFAYFNSTLTCGVDPLSRRSLLMHTSAAGLIITSTRSGVCRQAGMEMRALDGGELVVLHLSDMHGHQPFSDALASALNAGTLASQHALRTVNAVLGGHMAPTDVMGFLQHLEASVRRRVDNVPVANDGRARIAILFSGGVDCTLLAALVHRCLPCAEAIELVNVAFSTSTTISKGAYDTPDRQSALAALAELRAACPGREWRFVAVDAPAAVAREHRQAVVDLMYPCSSEMDLSLAFPLYFAARGIGELVLKDSRMPYLVQSRVYISGLGADEQLGGYGRHRKAFERGGHDALVDEINLDFARLPTRNLARDDRILSSGARDARYPYLDLSFVAHLSALPLAVKCDFALPPGEGDKRLLRAAAARLGLPEASARVKRAMQFGTRSAKLGAGVKKGESASAVAIAEA